MNNVIKLFEYYRRADDGIKSQIREILEDSKQHRDSSDQDACNRHKNPRNP